MCTKFFIRLKILGARCETSAILKTHKYWAPTVQNLVSWATGPQVVCTRAPLWDLNSHIHYLHIYMSTYPDIIQNDCWSWMFHYILLYATYKFAVGWDSTVSIVTHYRLDVRGSNPSGGEIFYTCPDQLWGPPTLLYNGYRLSFPGVNGLGMALPIHPHLAPRLKEE